MSPKLHRSRHVCFMCRCLVPCCKMQGSSFDFNLIAELAGGNIYAPNGFCDESWLQHWLDKVLRLVYLFLCRFWVQIQILLALMIVQTLLLLNTMILWRYDTVFLFIKWFLRQIIYILLALSWQLSHDRIGKCRKYSSII